MEGGWKGLQHLSMYVLCVGISWSITGASHKQILNTLH